MSGWVAGATVVSSLVGANASRKAANTQAAAAGQASDLQREMFQQTRADQEPWRQAGINALGEMQRTAGNVPAAFKFGDYEFKADPSYGFRLSEGQKALDRQAAARGGLISGGALKAATRFGQEMGSLEFGNAYNRALTSYGTDVARENQLYNRQAALAGIGQTATNLVGTAGQNYATSAGNLMTGAGAATAAGQVGMSNALTGGLSTYLNYSQNNALLNALQRNQNMQLVNSGGFSNTPAYMVNPPRDDELWHLIQTFLLALGQLKFQISWHNTLSCRKFKAHNKPTS
jgi:hypothetical protein